MANQYSNLPLNKLHELFEYRDGNLYWKSKSSPKSRITIGSIAGRICESSYSQISINNKQYLTHRIIFKMHHGYLPQIIDHIDGNYRNNKIENLREATAAQNMWNSKVSNKSSSNIKGVYWHKSNKKWIASCGLNNKLHHLGYFADKDDAIKAVKEFRSEHHKDFARD